jgi:hypothetical protein
MKAILCRIVGCKLDWNHVIIDYNETGVECSRCKTRYFYNQGKMMHRIEKPNTHKKGTCCVKTC